MVATSTPEMKELKQSLSAAFKQTGKKAKSSRRLFDDQSDSDVDVDELIGSDSDSCDDTLEFGPVKEVPLGSYVLCEFAAAKSKFYYIGHVLKVEDTDGDLEIEFFRRSAKVKNKFVKPHQDDIATFHKSGVKCILPVPTSHGTTERTKGGLTFNIDFGRFDVR